MQRRFLLLAALFLCGCNGNSDLDRQQNILDQIVISVTVSIEDAGPAQTSLDGKWENYRFKVSNEFRDPVFIFKAPASMQIDEASKSGNPQGYFYNFQVKNMLWSDANMFYGSKRDLIAIQPGSSVEFIGLFHKDAPISKGTNIRGYVTVYCEPTDLNGRHITSAPLPMPQ